MLIVIVYFLSTCWINHQDYENINPDLNMSSSDKCELVSEQLMCELANLPNASHLKKRGKNGCNGMYKLLRI